jgi:hypothetical protein
VKILEESAQEVQQLINGYIRYLRDQKSGVSLLIRESAEEGDPMPNWTPFVTT